MERIKPVLNGRRDGKKSALEQADEMLLQERFVDAEHMYKRVLTILKESLGPEHHEVASIMHKLAAALAGQGKNKEAAPLEKHANVIMSVNNEH
jgi:hypothetical protein